jgi:uncharacterized protein (DUF302 family)
MKYYIEKTTDASFEEAITRVTEELKKEGFGVLTEIDVSATLKKKIDVDFKNYRILGACNPSFAYKALSTEDKIGTMLPCNIIVQQISASQVEIAAVNPIASMQAIENDELNSVANEILAKLERVISNS